MTYVSKFDAFTERTVQFKETQVQGKDETESILKYADIDYVNEKCKVEEAPEVEKEKLDGQDSTCCLQVTSQEKEIVYCPQETIRCHRYKRMMQKQLLVPCE